MALTAGISIACTDRNRRGGAKSLWLTEQNNITSFTTGTDHDYSAVTMDATTVKFWKFEFDPFTGGINSEGSKENGSDVQTVTGEFKFPKLEKAKAETLNTLKQTCKVVAIVEGYNGKFFVAGWDETLNGDAALDVTINENQGTGLQDENGYTLTVNGTQAELMREFTGDTTDSVIFEQ